MSAHQVTCWSCNRTWEFFGTMARGDVCEGCGWDARVCLNCKFHDSRAYRECLEEQAELVKDKDKRNFCSYFEGKLTQDEIVKKPKDNPLDRLFGSSNGTERRSVSDIFPESSSGKSKIEEELEAFFKK
ncbi:MAG: hypothetical protein NTV34_07600 [Proteobacteria bacterium]|nr:hypothetical protein [Pseudomonadota bacterium]